MDPNQPTFQLLTVIAREVYGKPEYAGWKARIRDRLMALRIAVPDPWTLNRVMDATERAIEAEEARQRRRRQAYLQNTPIEQLQIVPDTFASLHPEIQELVMPVFKRFCGQTS